MSYTLSSIPLLSLLFFFHVAAYHRALHSFPTRRSSDLVGGGHRGVGNYRDFCVRCSALNAADVVAHALEVVLAEDRKSTRLNSSHVAISYAVFCLKKKRKVGDVLVQTAFTQREVRVCQA